MGLHVEAGAEGHRLVGPGGDVELVNRFLAHLSVRNLAAATRRAYAFDLLSFLRFCDETGLTLAGSARPACSTTSAGGQPPLVGRSWSGSIAWRPLRPRRTGGLQRYESCSSTWCSRRSGQPARCRQAVVFVPGNGAVGCWPTWATRAGPAVGWWRSPAGCRSRWTLRTWGPGLGGGGVGGVGGGWRSAEVRSVRLADVDQGLRRVRVVGKGGKERVVPIDCDFFAELGRYLREERPAGCQTPECFVVLRGPTRGQPMGEAALRRIFRTHRELAGTPRVRPHRLRHTYGTELAGAGIDLLVLRDLMGHASPETTAGYVKVDRDALAVLARPWPVSSVGGAS